MVSGAQKWVSPAEKAREDAVRSIRHSASALVAFSLFLFIGGFFSRYVHMSADSFLLYTGWAILTYVSATISAIARFARGGHRSATSARNWAFGLIVLDLAVFFGPALWSSH